MLTHLLVEKIFLYSNLVCMTFTIRSDKGFGDKAFKPFGDTGPPLSNSSNIIS